MSKRMEQNYKVIALFPTDDDIELYDVIMPYKDINFYYINMRTNVITNITHPEKYPHLFHPVNNNLENPIT